MEEFALEVFTPRGGEPPIRDTERLRAAARALQAEGVAVRYLHALHLPADETCFHVVGAESLASVRLLRARAALSQSRVVPASLMSASGGPS